MFTPTRAAALERLKDFIHLIPSYGARRSFARDGDPDVSRLSPYIRHRIVSEQEVLGEVLRAHSFQCAEKFIQELVWRTYWKGWLERNPDVWSACVTYDADAQVQSRSLEWSDGYAQACSGRTRLKFFNEWTNELVQSGYLHNHIRMWFASVWIFTLRLPWQLGSMFMYRHLVDGDPASNTLSWRWVAGLQTKGKRYLATADNISRYSEGRWVPAPGELAEGTFDVESVDGAELKGSHQQGAPFSLNHGDISGWSSVRPDQPYGIVTTSEDLSVDQITELTSETQAIAILSFQPVLGESDRVVSWKRGAEGDLRNRLGSQGTVCESGDGVVDWALSIGLARVVIVMPAVGSQRDAVVQVARRLSDHGVACFWYLRPWDRELLPLADRGFFPFWERVRKRIERRGALIGV